MRTIHLWYPDFLKFNQHLIDTVTMFEDLMTPLITRFTVKGGWAMPKDIVNFMENAGVKLDSYGRWFLILDNGWTMCALFTESSEQFLGRVETDTHYTGFCNMNVEFYFIETILILHYIATDIKETETSV